MKPCVSGPPPTRRPAALPRRWSWPRRASCLPSSRWLLAIRLSLLWQPGGLGRAGGSAPLVAETRADAAACRISRLPMQARLGGSGAEGPARAAQSAVRGYRNVARAQLLRRLVPESKALVRLPLAARLHPARSHSAVGRGETIALGLRGPADAIGKAIARRMPAASSCMTTAQPGRTSSPPRPARRLLAWQRDHASWCRRTSARRRKRSCRASKPDDRSREKRSPATAGASSDRDDCDVANAFAGPGT